MYGNPLQFPPAANSGVPKSSVEKAGGRQEPRYREAGRRKHGTTMTRRKHGTTMTRRNHGRAASGQGSCVSFATNGTTMVPKFVEKSRRSPRPRHREAGRRKHGTTMTRRKHGRAASGQATCSFSNPLEFHLLLILLSFGTNTATMAKISTHLLSSTSVSWNSGLQSQLCELTFDARPVRCICVHATIATVRIDHRRTLRAVDLCARVKCQHFCTDGREEIAQWLSQYVSKMVPARRITHITSVDSFPSVIVQWKFGIMTVAGVLDRTLWQNTVGKDFSDPSCFRSPGASTHRRYYVPQEVSPVVVNPV